MLKLDKSARGFTIVEALVVLTIIGVMAAWGVPAFATWTQNTRIRGTAESILSGLQYARGEASSRNAAVRFQLVTGLNSTCVRSANSAAWVVDVVDANDDSVEGQCNLAPNDVNPTPPSILQSKSARDGSGSTRVQAAAGANGVVFNGLGRVTPTPTTDIEYTVGGILDSQCREAGGDLTCLRIRVAAGGQIRMCSDSYPVGDPQRC